MEKELAFDMNGNPIHKGDMVYWYDPEFLNKRIKYEVYEEPTEEMVKLCNDYGECEAFPCECKVIV